MPVIEATPAKPRFRIRTDGTVVSGPAPRSEYMRGGKSPMLFRWNPALRNASEDIRSSWRLATARTVDVLQNNGWLSGAVEQSAAHVVGPNGLKLNAQPDADSLGWDRATANEWARRVEARFASWSRSARACDAGNRSTFSELQNQAYEHWLATGEVLAAIPFDRRPGTQWGTKIDLLPAWQIVERNDAINRIEHGVKIGPGSNPVALVLKETFGTFSQERMVSIEEPNGRRLLVHLFRGSPRQVRGITPFVSVLKVTRQFDQLADATLTSALIQAVFAAMFTSQAPSDEVLGGLQTATEQANAIKSLAANQIEWYENADFDLGQPGRVLHGYPGDDLKFFRSESPNETYEPFAKFLLREVSRAAALTYEEFSGDYAGATFSSVKMGISTTWPRIERRRNIPAQLCQAAYEAWLEEDIEIGGTEFPGGVPAYLAQRDLAAKATWRGPTRPKPDEFKAANAAKVYQGVGVPDQVLFDELGLDVDEVYDARAREKQRRSDLGIDNGASTNTAASQSDAQEDEETQPED